MAFIKLNKVNKLILLSSLSVMLNACDSAEEVGQNHFEKGKELFEKGEYDKAILELKSSTQEGDQRADTYYYMALLDEKNSNYKAMKENLQKTIELDPNNMEARKKMGKVNLLFGEMDGALQQADFVLKSDPESEEAKLLKASAFIKQKKGEQAKDLIESVLAKSPNHIDALSLKAGQAFEENDNEKAIEIIDTALKIDPKNLPLRVFKIKINAKQNKVDDVIDGYKQLVELYPDADNFKLTLASVYSMSDKLDLAEQVLREIIAKSPNKIEPKLTLLEFLDAKAKDKVGVEFDRMLSESSGNAKAVLELSKWMLTSNYLEAASKGLNQVIEKNKSDKDGLMARTILAEIDLNKKEYDNAEKAINSILEDDSEFIEASLLKAKLLLVRNNADEAIELLNKIVWSKTDSDNAYALLGHAYLIKKDKVQSDKNYKQALDINPANIQAFTPIYNEYLEANQKENARQLLNKALKAKPNQINFLNFKADLDISEKKWDDAQETVQNIAIFSKNKAMPLYFQANILQGKGKYIEAVKLYEDLLSKYPDHLNSMINMVRSYDALSQREKALAYLENHHAKHKDDLTVVGVLSDLYLSNKDYLKAKNLLQNQIKLSPDKSVPLYLGLARVESVLKNNPAAAKEIYLKGLEENPDNDQLLNALASLYEQLDNKQDARKIYEKILDKNPNVALSINNLASLLLYSDVDEDNKKALELAEAFKDSDNVYFKDTYAWALVKNGKTKEGLKILESLILKEPKFAEIRYHLGVAHLDNGNKATALVELKQAISLAEKQNQTFAGKEKIAQLIKELEHY